MPATFTRFRLVSHTGTDNKDKENGMVGVLISRSEIVFAFGPIGTDLNYRAGDDNDWIVHDRNTGLYRPLSSDEIPHTKLVMSMTGDNGDWISAFSLWGFTREGAGNQLVSRTGYEKFRSGHNDHYEFPLTAVSKRASEETLAIIEAHRKSQTE